MLPLIIASIGFSLVMSPVAATKCDAKNFRYASHMDGGHGDHEFPLKTANASSPVKVSGTLQIIDGCTFGVKNLVISGTDAESLSWFAGNGSSHEGYRLASESVKPPTAPITQQWKFVSTPGSEVSYDDFNQFRLCDETSRTLLAVADITLPEKPVGTASDASADHSGHSHDEAATPASSRVSAMTSSPSANAKASSPAVKSSAVDSSLSTASWILIGLWSLF